MEDAVERGAGAGAVQNLVLLLELDEVDSTVVDGGGEPRQVVHHLVGLLEDRRDLHDLVGGHGRVAEADERLLRALCDVGHRAVDGLGLHEVGDGAASGGLLAEQVGDHEAAARPLVQALLHVGEGVGDAGRRDHGRRGRLGEGPEVRPEAVAGLDAALPHALGGELAEGLRGDLALGLLGADGADALHLGGELVGGLDGDLGLLDGVGQLGGALHGLGVALGDLRHDGLGLLLEGGQLVLEVHVNPPVLLCLVVSG